MTNTQITFTVAVAIGVAGILGLAILSSKKPPAPPELTVNEYQVQRAITYCAGDQTLPEGQHNSIDFLIVTPTETRVMCENGANTILTNGFTAPTSKKE